MEGHTDTRYARVAPRDLFNEAKLLTCLGRLALLIHDGFGPETLTFDDSGNPYRVGLHEAGYLTATQGLRFRRNGRKVWLGNPYNSRAKWPMVIHLNAEDTEVFDETGELSADFLALFSTKKADAGPPARPNLPAPPTNPRRYAHLRP